MTRTDRKSTTENKQIRCILLSGLLAAAGSILLLLVSAVLVSRGWFSLTFAPKLALISCACSGFFGALFAVKQTAGKSRAVGFAVGLIQFVSLYLLGLLILENVAPGLDQLPMAASCLCSAGLAGLLRKKGMRKRRS